MSTFFESAHKRITRDLYETPKWVTKALLPYLRTRPPALVWEPACGNGMIADVLIDEGYAVSSTDIADGTDFLKTDGVCEKGSRLTLSPNLLVTNPPYSNSLPEKFIRHALEVTRKSGGEVAMLLDATYICAKRRADLFATAPFASMVVIPHRICWANLPQDGHPKHSHAWYIWDWGWAGSPQIHISKAGPYDE